MQHYKSLLALLVCLVASLTAFSQTDEDKARLDDLIQEESDSVGWVIGGGIGLDLANVLVINPRPGGGQNRWGIGGALGLYANYRKDRITWFNNLSFNLGLEKVGSGTIPDSLSGGTKIPFRKTIDEIRLNSTFGYKTAPESKWSYVVDFWFRSQLTPSYIGVEDGQTYVSEVDVPGAYENSLVAKFMAPARFNLGLGVRYDPNEQWSFTYTPLTADLILITDQDIANLGVHGTFLEEGSDSIYQKTRWGLGSKLTVKYQNKFIDDRLIVNSSLSLFSDYLNNPQNIDVDWSTEIAFQIIGGLQLSYTNNIYYDDDVLSTVSDFDEPGGIARNPDGTVRTAPTVNYYHQILLKYVQVF